MDTVQPDAQIITQMLLALYDHYFMVGMGKVETWELLAGELSESVGHLPPWTWRYIEGVGKQRAKMKPSPALAHAVTVLGAMIDGMPQVVANTERVTVLALPGAVQPGALIQGKSIRCGYPPCPAVIVPRWANQKYCCHECGQLNARLERRKRRKQKR